MTCQRKLVSVVGFCGVRRLASTYHIPVHRILRPRHHLQIIYHHRGCPGCIVNATLSHRQCHLRYRATFQYLLSNSPPLYASGSCQKLSNSSAKVNSMRSDPQHLYSQYHYQALSSGPVTILGSFGCAFVLPSRRQRGFCHRDLPSLRDRQLTM